MAIRSGHQDLVPDWKPKRGDRDENWMTIPRTNVSVYGSMFKKKAVFFEDDLIVPFVGRVSKYVLDRGVSIDTARAWELGVDRPNGRALFILRDVEGRIGVVIGRDTTGRSRVKYSNYVLDKRNNVLVPFPDHSREEDFEGPTKSCFLYGEHLASRFARGEVERRANDLVIVEGAIDVLKTWQLGWNVVAILGSHFSNDQIEKVASILPKDGRVILMMDGDEAGRACAQEAGKTLIDRVPVLVAMLPDDADPGAAQSDEINSAIENAKVFSLTLFK
jgi:hypothetical protein